MIGSQCLIAYRNSTGLLHAYTSPITSYATRLEEGPLSFRVSKIGAEFNNNEMIIYATLELPNGTTKFIEVWQYGSWSHECGELGDIDACWSNGSKLFEGVQVCKFSMVLYTRDVSIFIIGVAGFATGLKLGSRSSGVVHTTHRNIGITLFVLGTLQAFAILLRPKPDHKYRKYWNVYHQAMGYSVLILSIVNILDGLDILDPGKKWKRAYIGVLIFLGSIVVVLEALTWYIVFKRKRQSARAPNESSIGA
ncbi:hypothetical protein BUALT_Bualt12G0088500 [Buddleja alternifolia]|uniref:Cytochrome b561 domain-containing protein n=1 Tax=Buddleja alternifolia TaxID=168488 RepID=A0AAV6WR23_9LAMI|nr:hypothetical protein BUALT_Bualt12G0088500 [Buddleja alternifolia]